LFIPLTQAVQARFPLADAQDLLQLLYRQLINRTAVLHLTSSYET
jgi:hypothetical protein